METRVVASTAIELSIPAGGWRPRRAKGEREALDRITLPDEVQKLMSERLWPGASLIVSDYGFGETGVGTDFVILTR